MLLFFLSWLSVILSVLSVSLFIVVRFVLVAVVFSVIFRVRFADCFFFFMSWLSVLSWLSLSDLLVKKQGTTRTVSPP